MIRHVMLIVLLLMTSVTFLQAEEKEKLTAEMIIKKVDENMVADNRKAKTTIIIHGRRGTRTMTSQSWVSGMDKSYTEYLSPAREKGTKMLKLGDELWIYSPDTDRTIRIAGHLLRQSMMGSDISYEDYMEDPELNKLYDATLLGEERFNDRDCYIIELNAKSADLAYVKRKVWIDKEYFLGMREERYAKSGKLLKTFTINSIIEKEGRFYPEKMVVKDELQRGDGTEIRIDDIEFNVEIEEHIFSKASLRR